MLLVLSLRGICHVCIIEHIHSQPTPFDKTSPVPKIFINLGDLGIDKVLRNSNLGTHTIDCSDGNTAALHHSSRMLFACR
jgi:hypothetical protein